MQQEHDFKIYPFVQRYVFDYGIDACIGAMEQGTLNVCAQEHVSGTFLWEYYNYTLTVDHIARICALLQRRRLPPSLLWRKRLLITTNTSIAALSHIDYMWQDLDGPKWTDDESGWPG
jgi:hypothetical protein